MTVHFIGAGPGAPELITVRGRELIARCPVCLYAGSLVPKALLDHCPAGARIVDTAPLSLDEIEAEFVAAQAAVSSPLLNASNLAKLADDIQVRTRQNIDACRQLVKDVASLVVKGQLTVTPLMMPAHAPQLATLV